MSWGQDSACCLMLTKKGRECTNQELLNDVKFYGDSPSFMVRCKITRLESLFNVQAILIFKISYYTFEINSQSFCADQISKFRPMRMI